MYGTLLNASTVFLGSLLGLFLKHYIPPKLQSSILNVTGVCIIIIGINGIIETMFTVENNLKLTSTGGILLMTCIVIGYIIGYYLNLSYHFSSLGKSIQHLLKMKSNFAKAFVDSSILYCVGAMAIVGCLQEGLYGNSSFLILKSSFDFVTAIIIATSMGIGVTFSSISILLCQGILTLCAKFISPWATPLLINNVSMIGYVIVFMIGLNFVFKTDFETENLLPSIILAIPLSFLF